MSFCFLTFRGINRKIYFKGGVTPATTFWTLIYNFRVIYFRNSWATKHLQINGLTLVLASATVLSSRKERSLKVHCFIFFIMNTCRGIPTFTILSRRRHCEGGLQFTLYIFLCPAKKRVQSEKQGFTVYMFFCRLRCPKPHLTEKRKNLMRTLKKFLTIWHN